MGCTASTLPEVQGSESDQDLYMLVQKGSADAAHCLLKRHETLDLTAPIIGSGRPPKRAPKLGLRAADARPFSAQRANTSVTSDHMHMLR